MSADTPSALARQCLDSAGQERLLRFVALLRRWNARRNLLSRRDIEHLWPRHIDDSLLLLPWLEGRRLLDLGSGGGLPGLLLALARGDLQVTLMERSVRKCAFLRQAATDLPLSNVRVICADFARQPEPRFDTVVARAVAPPAAIWPIMREWLVPGGVALVPVGPNSAQNLPTDPAAAVEWCPMPAKQAAYSMSLASSMPSIPSMPSAPEPDRVGESPPPDAHQRGLVRIRRPAVEQPSGTRE